MDVKSLPMCRGHFININELPKNPVIVDAGMFRGEFSRWIYDQVKAARMFGFEAEPGHIAALRRRCKMVDVFHAALIGDSPLDTVQFHSYGQGNGAIMPKHADKRYSKIKRANRTTQIAVVKINDLLDFLGVDHLDYLKLDVEGSEHGIFKHMLPQTADKIMQFSMEVHVLTSDPADRVAQEYKLAERGRELGFKCKVIEQYGEVYGWRY